MVEAEVVSQNYFDGQHFEEVEEIATDEALLSIGLDAELVRDTRPVRFDDRSEEMLSELNHQTGKAASQEAYEEAKSHQETYQVCLVAAAALQSLAADFQSAVADENFQEAADIKAKAIEIRLAQEKAFDPATFERLEKQKSRWQKLFGRDNPDPDLDACLSAYHDLIVKRRAGEHERDVFLSCLPRHLLSSLIPALLELESLALA